MANINRSYKDCSFERYLNEKYAPAQRWAKSEMGEKWIEDHCDALTTSIIQRCYDQYLHSCYSLSLNGNICYIGQTIKPANRLCVHIYDLVTSPELFGLQTNELDEIRISANILEISLYAEKDRKKMVEQYIAQLNPLLQLPSGRCIPLKRRRAVVEPLLKN